MDWAGAVAAMAAATGPGFDTGRKVALSLTIERMGDLGLNLDLDVEKMRMHAVDADD